MRYVIFTTHQNYLRIIAVKCSFTIFRHWILLIWYERSAELNKLQCYTPTCPLTNVGRKLTVVGHFTANTGTEYFKNGIYSQFFSLQNVICFIILTYLVPVLFTFYIQDTLLFFSLQNVVCFIILTYLLPVLFTFYIQDTLRFFSLQNVVCFIILTYLVPVLFAFYIQDTLRFFLFKM